MPNIKSPLLADPNYDPNPLLDTLIGRFKLKNDAALSRLLEVDAPMISKIRTKRTPVTAHFLVLLHDKANVQLDDARRLMGVPRHA